jgi:DNA-binding transcriptional regulator YhcF (GntR family)
MKGHFYISNKIIDDGYLKTMSGNDLKVLLKITRHYDKTGKSFPSIRKMSEQLNLHHETIAKSIHNLEVCGFLEQLEIRQRCKLRYIFSKSTRFLLINPNNVVEKTDSKDIKDIKKEENNFLENKIRTPEEQARIDKHLDEIAKKLNFKRKNDFRQKSN